MNKWRIVVLCIALLMVNGVHSACTNGCSSRGLCVNNRCVCAEGLTGSDCSVAAPSSLPSPYTCPECYTVTVGPARYYTGPYWRFPDTPLVTLNSKGTLSTYMSNSDAVLVAKGDDVEDWLPTSQESLAQGTAGNFDSCGAWMVRTIVGSDGNAIGFYHAERSCDYNNNGQTRKSAGYSVSTNGGVTFTKPNYPNNKLIDSPAPVLIGRPSGEGDYSVIVMNGYFYLFFSNVDSDYIGVARATWASKAVPGSFNKYLNGNWNSPGVGGNSTRLNNVAGPIASLHTPTNSILSCGNSNSYYWNKGYHMSASNDAINWKYFADPIITPDPITNPDLFLYGAFLGKTGGYDIGFNFSFYYMWLPPGKSLAFRYQIYKDITLTYTGPNNSAPSTKIALTTYISTASSEIWQTTELALPPYRATAVVGYLMSRPYSHTFPVYDCYNKVSGDHFAGTANECFFNSNIEVLRTMGYMWSARVAPSVALYRCTITTTNDMFLTNNFNCDGKAPAQTTPFGYVMAGPPLNSSIASRDTLVWQGSQWKFFNSTPPATWYRRNFDDSAWRTSGAPFTSGYSSELGVTPFGRTSYYFRKTFTIPSGKTIQWLLLSVASDDYSRVYINNQLIDVDPASTHEAGYWNRRIYVDEDTVDSGSNVIAVLVSNTDQYAFFDLQLTIKYAETAPPVAPVCSPACGTKGQCVSNICVCESGWGGATCTTNLCTLSGSTTQSVIPPGSTFYNTEWVYVPNTPRGWFAPSFNPSSWHFNAAPFGTSNYPSKATLITNTRHLFRKTFSITIPVGQVISSAQLYIASDDTHRVYLNGIYLGAQIYPSVTHAAQYWNDVISVDSSVLLSGSNTIAIEVPLVDGHTSCFFDMQLNVTFSIRTCGLASGSTSTTKLASTSTTKVSSTSTTKSSTSTTKSATTSTSTTKSSTSTTKSATTTTTTGKATTTTGTAKVASSPVQVQLFRGTNSRMLALSVVEPTTDISDVSVRDSGRMNNFQRLEPYMYHGKRYYSYEPSSAFTLPLTVRVTCSNSAGHVNVTNLTAGNTFSS